MDFVVNKIYTQIPRVYVNIVLLFNISQGICLSLVSLLC